MTLGQSLPEQCAAALFFLACALVFHTYVAYPAFLRVLIWLGFRSDVHHAARSAPTDWAPTVCVVVAAHNEARVIEPRVQNLLAQDYPRERYSVLIVSDGSTDDTVHLASNYGPNGVKVIDNKLQRGRAACHNDAVAAASEEILVFTDADTVFEPDFLRQIVRPFISPRVGVATGQLGFVNTGVNGVAQSAGLYWRYELWLRQMESVLGCLATASGACMAVRRALIKPLLRTDDVDYSTPLDVIMQGHVAVHESTAVAYDSMPSTVLGEIRARTRQVAKNLPGTLRKLRELSPLRFPLLAFSVASHKLLRWLTPVFLLVILGTNPVLVNSSRVFAVVLALQVAFYLAAGLGCVGQRMGARIPMASTAFGFCVANIAFFLGTVKALFFQQVTSYRSQQ